MRALRSCIESTMCRVVTPLWPISLAMSVCGMTPTTSPPASSIASATTPIRPTLPPP